MSHLERVLNTILQVLAALAVMLPLALANTATLGWELPGPALVAAVGATTMVVATVHNVVRQRGSTPILRTFLQILIAVAGVATAVVAKLGEGGIDLPAEAIAAIAGLVIVVVTGVMNLLEQLDVIPELGKGRS